MSKSLKIGLLIIIVAVAISALGYWAYRDPNFNLLSNISRWISTRGPRKTPPVADYFLNSQISDERIDELARYDVITLDMEAQHVNPEKIRAIRAKNPDIKILAYVTSEEIRTDASDDLGWNELRHELYQGIQDSWWVKDPRGQPVFYWPGTWMLNPDSDWATYLTEFMQTRVMATGLWDGVMYDNVWTDMGWLSSQVDLNRDRRADDIAVVNQKWSRGMRHLLQNARDLAPGATIITNGPGKFSDLTNGRIFENFPNQYENGYLASRLNYFAYQKTARNPAVNIVNTTVNNGALGDQTNYQRMRYGLTTCLLSDGFYSFDWGEQTHNETWWYDEYDTDIGDPVSNPYPIQDFYLYYDDFENSNLGNYQLVPGKGSLTQNPRETVDGYVSAKGDNRTKQLWNEFLVSDPARLHFVPGEKYAVRIKYRILLANDPGKSFYFLAHSPTGGYSQDRGYTSWNDRDNPKQGEIATTLELGNFNDYSLRFGIYGQGAVAIDDISITKDDSDFSVWRRDFRKGIVLVNPTPVPQRIILETWYRKIKGTQAPQFNDGQRVKELVLPPKDGIILKRPPNIENFILHVGDAAAVFGRVFDAVFNDKPFTR